MLKTSWAPSESPISKTVFLNRELYRIKPKAKSCRIIRRNAYLSIR